MTHDDSEPPLPESTPVPRASGIGRERGVFANRTLNLRSVRAIGYDMDYTLIHYHADRWEAEAFGHACELLARQGLPVEGLKFDPEQFIQGLVIDLDTGNLVKATRFGYVIQAAHGTRSLRYDELRSTYSGVVVDLAEPRFRFLNTMFSLSEASLYAQLVDLLDEGILRAPDRMLGYDDLYRIVLSAMDETHATERLKAKIVSEPGRYVEPDPGTAQTLLDQRAAGKKVLLITNSGWQYTNPMMSFVFDRTVGSGSWRDLFDLVVCGARKPDYFQSELPVWRLVDAARGWFEPQIGSMREGEVYQGGNAALVESSLGMEGDEILYVGDHLFGDVHVSKATLRWRTALILRALEAEIAAAAEFAPDQNRLNDLMRTKSALEQQLSEIRFARLDASAGGDLDVDFRRVRVKLLELDGQIAPLAVRSAELVNRAWGPLMRAGSDKSLFARQVEKYADIYTSRVSNLAARTPFAYYRAVRTSLPHDRA